MEVSNPQVEEITRHHRYTLDELESLLKSLRMELEVSPTDHKAHRDLFSRIIREAERGLEPPDPIFSMNIVLFCPPILMVVVGFRTMI